MPFLKKPVAVKPPKEPRKRKGSRQQCLRPTELIELFPQKCSGGCESIDNPEPYYIHQVIELPEIEARVSHVILYRGQCRTCGKTIKASVPQEMRIGFGPRMSAMIAELAAVHGNSRRAVQDFVSSVVGVPISQGAIQNVLEGDRFVERILSLRQTCRLQGKRTFCILVKAMEAFIQGTKPEIQWINSLSPNTL